MGPVSDDGRGGSDRHGGWVPREQQSSGLAVTGDLVNLALDAARRDDVRQHFEQLRALEAVEFATS